MLDHLGSIFIASPQIIYQNFEFLKTSKPVNLVLE